VVWSVTRETMRPRHATKTAIQTIVRYAPASRFSRHGHGGGEEFLVLEGVFQDEHGDFPAGSYIRNPPGTSHSPSSAPGCVIFVKLWQFDTNDREQLRVDTSRLHAEPAEERPGVELTQLFRNAQEDVRLERWAPGTPVTLPGHPGGLECLVTAGSFQDGYETFVMQSWLRLPPGMKLNALAGKHGCSVWLKLGRAAAPPPLPASPGS
jgi:quercetin dioxygenase-like cupin family protein